MPRLIETGGVVVLRALEGPEGRQHDAVNRRHVAGAIAALVDVGADRYEKSVGTAEALPFRLGLRHRVEVRRQAFDMADVEHPEIAEETDLALPLPALQNWH